MNQEPRAIDSKDEPGQYRDQVRAGVLKRVGMSGQPVTSRDDMVGTWDVGIDTSFGKLPPEPTFVYHLEADGGCVIDTMVGTNTLQNSGTWRLHDDGTLTLDQSRYFLLALADGRRVLWNGDGSLLLVLSRRG
jgi:hypothetical protein